MNEDFSFRSITSNISNRENMETHLMYHQVNHIINKRNSDEQFRNSSVE